jgi:aerotaxis receptor
MAATPKVRPLWQEATFESEGLDARALITRTDPKGIITFASLAYRKMTKFDKDDLIGNPHSVVRHPFMPEAAFRDMWDEIKKGNHFNALVMNLRKDGKHYWVDVHIDPIDESGNIVNDPSKIHGFVAVRREPSRKEIQEAYKLYKSMRKAELLAKSSLKPWEEELLKFLDQMPSHADDFL